MNVTSNDDLYSIVLGDLGPEMALTLKDDDQTVILDLVNDVVTMTYVGPDAVTRTVTLTITSSRGGLSRAWTASDLPVVGTYRGQIKVSRSGDATFPRTYPHDGGKVVWKVTAPLALASSPGTQFTNASGSPVAACTPVYQTTTSHFGVAVASDATRAIVVGLVADDTIANGAAGLVFTSGPLVKSTGAWDAITGGTGGLVPGQAYYLAKSPPGRLTRSPVANGAYLVHVGVASAPTQLDLSIDAPLGPIGTAITGVTLDALSGVMTPATALEWDILHAAIGDGTGGPTEFWQCQEAATPLAGGNGRFVLNGVGTGANLAYQTAVTGWSRKGVSVITDPTDHGFSHQGTGLPDPGATSYLFYALVQLNGAPATDQGFIGINNAAYYAACKTGTKYLATGTSAGQASASSSALPIGSVFPVFIQYSIALQAAKVYTPFGVVDLGYTNQSGAELILGVASASSLFSASATYLQAALYTGTSADKSEATIGALMRAIGFSVSWFDAAATAGLYYPLAANQWNALGIVPPLVAYSLQESAGGASTNIINSAIAEIPVATTAVAVGATGVPGSSRVAFSIADAASGPKFGAPFLNAALLPDMATTSAAMLVELTVLSATHGTGPFWSWCFGLGALQLVSVHVDTAGRFGIYVEGTPTTGTIVQLGNRVRALLVYDVTHSRAILYTPAEKITGTYAADAQAKGFNLGNDNGGVPAPHALLSHAAIWSGSAAEFTDAQARATLQKLGETVAW